jgi:hypothetical protein
MRTEDLITSLSRDAAVREWSMLAVLLAASGAAVLLTAVPFYALVGLRDPAGAPFVSLSFGMKVMIVVALVAAAAMLVDIAGRPGARVPLARLAVPLGILLSGIAVEIATQPGSALLPLLVGQNALKCLVFIPLLSILPLMVSLSVMARAAPTEPRVAGAMVGVFAGAIGAAIYAVHCPDDSPLFLAVWYLLGVSAVTAAGALLGPRMLRW